MKQDYHYIHHTLSPIFDFQSKILILGTMPSPMSRELNMYYAHPQNRFWKVISQVLNCDFPQTDKDKINLLHTYHIALWDVLAFCNIQGASDQSIKDPIYNDLNLILSKANIKAIFTTGSKASALYKKHYLPTINIEHIELPSTSPANCRYYNLDRLISHYKVILNYL